MRADRSEAEGREMEGSSRAQPSSEDAAWMQHAIDEARAAAAMGEVPVGCVIVKDGAMRAGRVMSMTLSVDHRVVDGALAAQWMAKLKERLENPETELKT